MCLADANDMKRETEDRKASVYVVRNIVSGRFFDERDPATDLPVWPIHAICTFVPGRL